MKTYDNSFQRFLILNAISQKTDDLYLSARDFVSEAEPEQVMEFQQMKKDLLEEKEALSDMVFEDPQMEAKNYINTLETFIHETELTVGFVILDDMEQYTTHLEETRKASRYIQESTLELLDVELTAYQPIYEDLQKQNDYFFVFIIFLFLTTSILAVFFALWFSKGITQPIQTLAYAAREVSQGDLRGEPIMIESSDELKDLGDAFNHMRDNIHHLVEEIKDQSELDQLLKDMEIKQLQNQINPHFLFNTLNTLSKMAYLEEAKTTSVLIESVATMLRHSLGEIDKNVTLEDEVEVVKGYFHIQKTRFAERIDFELNIDETCLDSIIPRMTLQPLIENAFIHGIEEREEGGTIAIRIYHAKNDVIVEVKDDGVGMNEETIHEIMTMADREEEHVGHSTGIGLTNVMRRLQLFYKMDDVLTIDSAPGKGTVIQIYIPKENGGVANEDINCGR